MFRRDVIHNRKTILYIFCLAIILSSIVTVFQEARKFNDRLFVIPLSVISYKEKLTAVDGYDNKNAKQIVSNLSKTKSVFYDNYIYKIQIRTSAADKISIYNEDYLIFSADINKDLSIKRYIIPFNLDVKGILIDTLTCFAVNFLKYFLIFFLVVYLIIDRINYSTELRIHTKQETDDYFSTDKLVFSNAVSFKEFIVWIIKSIMNVFIEIFKNKYLFWALAIVSLMMLPIAAGIYVRNENNNMILFFAYGFHKMIFEPLVCALFVAVLLKIFKIKIVPAALFSVLIFVILADAAVYYFGFTVAERNHVSLITPYSVLSFLSWQTVFLFVLFLAVLIPINVLMIKGVSRIKIRKLAVVVLILSVINVPSFLYPLVSLFSGPNKNGVSIREINGNLAYGMQTTILNLFDELIYIPITNKPRDIDLKKIKEVAEYYGIPFGKRSGGLDVQQPEKIVLFTSESLSLDFLTLYNENVQPSTSAFYEIDNIKNKIKTDHYTTSHNTLQGMITTMNSHPNYVLLAEGGKYYFQNSFVKKLGENGYKTIFLRSASKYFADEDKIFTALGFQEIIGREDFEKDYPQYINGWGVVDRIVYKKLVDLLEKYKNEKVFIMVLGTDTHPLDGRKNFFGLQYPTTFKDYEKYKESAYFMNSVAHHSYDLYNLYYELKEKNLYDTEKTCFIYTADHACPLNPASAGFPDYPKTSLGRIPLIIDYNGISEADYKKTLSSQVDLAPTILDIAGIDPPESYWGTSLFSSDKHSSKIQYDQERIYIYGRNKSFTIHYRNGENKREKMLINYFHYVDGVSKNRSF